MADSYAQGEDSPKEDGGSDDAKILEEALARFRLAEEAENELRTAALADLKFAEGDQWPESVKADRNADGRPCLVINRIPQHIQAITNDQRQNRPSIKVHPVDDAADVETAKIIQGLVRHIEYNSNADSAYDTGFEGAVKAGFGFWRVVTEYADPLSFDQEILIKRIRNQFRVYLDPNSQEPDGSDAEWGFVFEDISKDAFKRCFPKADANAPGGWDAVGAMPVGWVGDNTVRVAEYFYKTYRQAEIVQLASGHVVEKAKLGEWAERQALSAGVSPDLTVVAERVSQIPVVRWCKHTAAEILERADWAGKYIPLIPVYGAESEIDGKLVRKGITRDAQDPQRMYNYWASAETEAIALAPRTPFIVEENQIKGYEADWTTANRRNHAFLKYKGTSLNGTTPLPPPQRNAFEPAVAAITQARMLAADDLKSTTGQYDAALGNKSNETSGVAIQRRTNQAQTSNFHFVDNLSRSIRHTGRVVIDLIPHIYDAARAARIIGEDGTQRIVKLNQPTDEIGKDGKPLIYRTDVGKYDVSVDVGPSYASKRQESVASMLELSRANPQITQIAGDLMVKNMDWPGAQEIAERLKKTLPPNLIDDPEAKKQPIPPQVQAQMQQMGQMLDQLTAKVNEQADEIQQKRVELESKERIEMAKIKRDYAIAMAQLDAKDSLVQFQADIANIERRLGLLNAHAPIEDVTQEQQQQPGGDMVAQDALIPYEDDMQPAGGIPADGGAQEPSSPTGGDAPGLPMEGINDNPSNFQ